MVIDYIEVQNLWFEKQPFYVNVSFKLEKPENADENEVVTMIRPPAPELSKVRVSIDNYNSLDVNRHWGDTVDFTYKITPRYTDGIRDDVINIIGRTSITTNKSFYGDDTFILISEPNAKKDRILYNLTDTGLKSCTYSTSTNTTVRNYIESCSLFEEYCIFAFDDFPPPSKIPYWIHSLKYDGKAIRFKVYDNPNTENREFTFNNYTITQKGTIVAYRKEGTGEVLEGGFVVYPYKTFELNADAPLSRGYSFQGEHSVKLSGNYENILVNGERAWSVSYNYGQVEVASAGVKDLPKVIQHSGSWNQAYKQTYDILEVSNPYLSGGYGYYYAYGTDCAISDIYGAKTQTLKDWPGTGMYRFKVKYGDPKVLLKDNLSHIYDYGVSNGTYTKNYTYTISREQYGNNNILGTGYGFTNRIMTARSKRIWVPVSIVGFNLTDQEVTINVDTNYNWGIDPDARCGFYIDIPINNSPLDREIEIIYHIKVQSTEFADHIHIKQYGAYSGDSVCITADRTSISYLTDKTGDISCEADWVSNFELEDGVLTFDITKNTFLNARTATIYINGEKLFILTQKSNELCIFPNDVREATWNYGNSDGWPYYNEMSRFGIYSDLDNESRRIKDQLGYWNGSGLEIEGKYTVGWWSASTRTYAEPIPRREMRYNDAGDVENVVDLEYNYQGSWSFPETPVVKVTQPFKPYYLQVDDNSRTIVTTPGNNLNLIVRSKPDWIKVSISGDRVTLVIDENTTNDVRWGVVNLDDLSYTNSSAIAIRQLVKNSFSFEKSYEEVDFYDTDTHTITFKTDSDYGYQVSNNDLIEVNITEGLITYRWLDINNSEDNKIVTITFAGQGCDNYGYITLIQRGIDPSALDKDFVVLPENPVYKANVGEGSGYVYHKYTNPLRLIFTKTPEWTSNWRYDSVSKMIYFNVEDNYLENERCSTVLITAYDSANKLVVEDYEWNICQESSKWYISPYNPTYIFKSGPKKATVIESDSDTVRLVFKNTPKWTSNWGYNNNTKEFTFDIESSTYTRSATILVTAYDKDNNIIVEDYKWTITQTDITLTVDQLITTDYLPKTLDLHLVTTATDDMITLTSLSWAKPRLVNGVLYLDVSLNNSLSRRFGTIILNVVVNNEVLLTKEILIYQYPAIMAEIYNERWYPIATNAIYTEPISTEFTDYTVTISNKNEIVGTYTGRAYREPDGNINICVNNIVENYLTSKIEIPFKGTFSIVDNYRLTAKIELDNGGSETFVFMNSWIREPSMIPKDSLEPSLWWRSTLSQPISNKFDPRQYLIYSWNEFEVGPTVSYNNEGDVLTDDSELSLQVFHQKINADTVTFSGIDGKFVYKRSCGDYALYYQNAYGGWDSLLVKAKRTDNIQSYDYNKPIDFEKGRYLNVITPTWEVYTDYGVKADRMFHLIESPYVYLHNLETNEITKVLIDESNCEFKNRFANYTFRIKACLNNYRK